MKINHIFQFCLFLVILIISTTACQKISVPENAQVIKIPPPQYQDEIPNHIGEFISFNGEIEFTYLVKCDQEINDDDACKLYLHETAHVVNIIMGLNKNNVTSSGKIIYSDGRTVKPDVFGLVPAEITGLVKKCDDQKSCIIDVYQLDGPAD
jgi:hypothetical protein